jgi:hypothetical protein
MARNVLSESFRVFRRAALRFMLVWGVVAVPFAAADDFAPGRWRYVPYYLAPLALSIAVAAMVDAVRRLRDGHCVGLGSYWRIAPKLLRLLVAGVIGYIGIAVGVLLLVLPGVVAAVRWSVFEAAIVHEDDLHVGFDALHRSNDLVRGHSWATLAIVLVPAVPILALSMPNVWLHNLGLQVAGLLLIPIVGAYGAIAIAVLYEHLTGRDAPSQAAVADH